MSIRDPERWQRAQDVFLSAAARPEPDRDAFLDAACVGDPKLKRAVLRLLDADRRGDRFIEDAIAEGGRLIESEAELGVGAFVGSYRLVRLIGRGGMGIVYLAERADQQFEKRVALKLVAPGIGDAERRQRFHAERQILANLDHPAIARLLDGGTAADGRPFLVMEYVEGEPIDRHCRTLKLDLVARLRLFRQVLEAVDHAHQHLVVHRDIKPENILVTASGSVKLLDFGIAKLLDQSPSDDSGSATTASMTPQYASPEQVRGKAVTTSSDGYALGLVLYRLLTDTAAYEVSGAAPAEVARIVCEVDPPRPSETARRQGGAPAWPAHLVGDLDAIIMKALRKERRSRYASVGQLAQDLDDMRDGQPVRARRGGNAYRLRKLVARHRAGAATTLVAVLAATLFTGRVVVERNRAEQAITLLGDLIALAEPAGEARRTRTAAEQRFAGRMDDLVASLDGRPQLQGRLLRSVGSLYHVLGMDDPARLRLEQALAAGREGGSDIALAGTLDALGELLRDAGEYPRAEALLREALSIRRQRDDPDVLRLAESLDNLAHVIFEGDGDAAEAEALYRQALELRRAELGDDALPVAESRNNLAQALQALERYDDAEAALRAAADVYRREQGDDPDLAMVLGNLGFLMVETGRAAAAEAPLREALSIDLGHFGESHGFVAQDRENLAWALQKRGAFDDAEVEYRRALAIRRARYGEAHIDTIVSTGNLANLFLDTGRHTQAVAPLRSVLAGIESLFDGEHPHRSQARINLAVALAETGILEEAESLLREALALRRRSPGEGSLAMADVESRLGGLLIDRGRLAEGEALLERALTALRTNDNADPRFEGRALHDLGRLHRAAGDCAAAIPVLRQALALREQSLDPAPWQRASTAAELGACLAAGGSTREARDLFDTAAPLLDGAGNNREATSARAALRRLQSHLNQQSPPAHRPTD